MNNDEWDLETIEEKSLDPIPVMYKSLSNNPKRDILKTLNIKVNVPIISEFLEGTCYKTTDNFVPFKQKYKKIPLVLGLVYLASPSNITVVEYPQGRLTTVTKDGVFIGRSGSVITPIGSKYKLRVYNIDIE